MKTFRVFFIAPAIALFALSAQPSFGTSFQGIGLGSTYKQWVAGWGGPAHATNICQSGSACYGTPVYNFTVGHAFMFSDVTFEKKVTSNFEINLANGTSYSSALHTAKYTLPTDSIFKKLTPTNSGSGPSCAIMYGSSKTLKSSFSKAGFKHQTGDFSLEFYGTTSDQSQTYFRTNDVQIVLISIGGYVSGC